MTSGSRECIDAPDKVEGSKFTKCNKKYCTIQRQELVVSLPKIIKQNFNCC